MILLIVGLFISCAKKNEKITDLNQVDGKRICVLTGSAGDLAARAAFPNSTFLDMVGSADAALAVKTGKADVFVYDKGVLLKIVEKNNDMKILNKPVSKLEVAAAFKKDNQKLVSEINSILDKLKETGELDSLRKKWIESNYSKAPLFRQADYNATDGVLKMGTSAIYEPYSFISNGKYTGLDIELSQIIGRLLHKKIEIVDMSFEALIPALQAGKIDFALSNFTVTEERKKLISYSEPYIVNDISVLVKK